MPHALRGSHFGRYEMIAPLGGRAMAEVYGARDPRMGREAAIKICAGRFSDRLERDVHALAEPRIFSGASGPKPTRPTESSITPLEQP